MNRTIIKGIPFAILDFSLIYNYGGFCFAQKEARVSPISLCQTIKIITILLLTSLTIYFNYTLSLNSNAYSGREIRTNWATSKSADYHLQ